MNAEHLKKLARNAQRLLPEFSLANGRSPKLAACQELVARLHGYPNWHAALEAPVTAPDQTRPRSTTMGHRVRKPAAACKKRRYVDYPELVYLNLKTSANYPGPDSSPASIYTGQIMWDDDDDEGDGEVQIGRVNAYVLDLYCETHSVEETIFDDAEAFMPLFDFDSGEILSERAMEVLDKDQMVMVLKLVIIDWVELDKTFRGSGLGLLAVSLLMRAIATDIHSIVAISLTTGYQRDCVPTNSALGVRRLTRYFSKLGFTRVAGTDLLVLSTDLQHPTIADAAAWCRTADRDTAETPKH